MKQTKIDERELTVRIVEEACGVKRPVGTDTASAYATIAATAELEQFQRIARVAIEFFRESEGAQ